MNVLLYLKNIYSGRDALFRHVLLFSVLGLMTVAATGYAAAYFGNLYGSFFDFAPLDAIKTYYLAVIAITLGIYFSGYLYSYVYKMFSNQDELPELSLSSFLIFIKMLPVLFVWKIYEFVFFAGGFIAIQMTSPWFYIYYAVLICLLPFLNILFVIFAKDFKYRPEVFSPVTILRILNNSLGAVILLFVQIIAVAVIPALIVYLLFRYSDSVNHQTVKISLKLGGLCLGMYFASILKFIYSRGLVDIVKNKLSDI